MQVRSHPLRDVIYDDGLDLEAIQTDESHDPNDWDRGPQLLKPIRQMTTWWQLPPLVRPPRKPGDDDE
jgi:hypothetical protein